MKKHHSILLGFTAIALAAIVTLTGCPSPTDSGGGDSSDTTVSLLDLTSKVTVPVKNVAPVTAFTETAQYTGTVTWQTATGASHTGAFAPGTVYKAAVTLTAKAGYTFTGVKANGFTYTYTSATVSNAADSGIVTITFPATAQEGVDTAVTLRDLTDKVAAPVTGAAPITAFTETSQYTGTVTWKTADANHSGIFAAGTVYKAVVTLTAKTDYTFTGVEANGFTYTYTGATVSNAADSGIVTITFPATGTETSPVDPAHPVPVSLLNLTDKVTVPVKNVTPITAFTETAQYTGIVTWKNQTDANHSGTFTAGTVYKAVVTLTAKAGYTFTGVKANGFTYTYTGATVSNAADSGIVTITFPATAQEGVDTAVTLRDLTDKVTAPVTDATPVTSFMETAQYTGTLTWQTETGANHSGTFAPGTVYKAAVTLTAKTDYTFTGVEANSFTYTGATASNAADSGIVTITFPATGTETSPVDPAHPVPVSLLNLTGKVTVPVKNAAPITAFTETAQYTGTVTWQTATGAFHSGIFAAGTVYKAVVTLTAKAGYTFTGVGANSFRYTGATSVSNAANSGTVTITFPATGTEINPPIGNGNAGITITFSQIADAAPEITGPTIYLTARDGYSSTATLIVDNSEQYTSIEWKVDNGTIGSGSSVTLNASNYSYGKAGRHSVTVEVMKGGVPYSKTVSFTVAY